MMKARLLSVSFVLAATWLAASPSSAGDGSTPLRGSAWSPKEVNLKLKELNGKTYDLAELRGQVLVVSFGATWCTPCIWELVAIEELKEEYEGEPVKFLWVSIEAEKQTSSNVLRHFAKGQRLTVPVLRDPAREVLSQFSAGSRVPVLVFIDAEGNFVAPAHHGIMREISDYKQLVRERVGALLRPPATKTQEP